MPIANVATGIMSKYTGSALASVLTGGLYRETAPQDVSFPYGVFNWVNNLGVGVFSATMEYHHLQFTIWTNDLNSATASTGLDALVSALTTLFDYAILTVTGWTATRMVFKGERPAISEDERVIGAIVEYELYISK
jgi:hypothetical protein